MHNRKALSIFVGTLLLLHCFSASYAQQIGKTRILFVFDASGSMWAKWGKTTRIDAAKNILINLIDSLKDVLNVELALRCYGFQSPVSAHDCKDTKLVVPFSENSATEIVKFIKEVKPNGYTPIAYSLTQTSYDFPKDKAKNVVILITDGIEECEGDPCTVSKQLQSRNIILRPYIVGIGIDDEKMKFFDCVGKYYLPKNEKDLGKILSNVVSEALNNTPVVVQLLNNKGIPVETDVEMCFTNARNGKVEYNYYHTMNSESKPDTFTIDPSIVYDLKINTVPPVYKHNITIEGNKINIISLKTPLGFLEIKSSSLNDYSVQCLIKKSGENAIVDVQPMNSTRRYITGEYDLDILTLPRLYIRKVIINQDETNKIIIPEPGTLDIDYQSDVIGQLFVNRNNILEYVISLNGAGSLRKESIKLQPGQYSIVYRKKDSKNTIETKTRNIKIISGGSETVSLD